MWSLPSSMKPRRSRRYCTSSMTRGASVHFAPSGFPGGFTVHRSVSGTSMVKAMDFPSGDQARFEGVSSVRVICVAPSASRYITQIWVPRGSPRAR